MESNERYYARRAREEMSAAQRALTAEGKARRMALAEAFLAKARQSRLDAMSGREAMVSSAGFEPATC